MRNLTTCLILLVLASSGWAKGQSLKLEGRFSDLEITRDQVAFEFSGTLLDSSHPSERSDSPIWDYPIRVQGLTVTSTNAICMDHKTKKNFHFQDDATAARHCMARIEDLVAAVQISELRFTGEPKILETGTLSFYDMAQIRRENSD